MSEAALIEALKNDETIKAYQRLEEKILSHPALKEKYHSLLEVQKRLVRLEAAGDADAHDAKKAYEAKKSELMDEPLIEQYLTLQSVVDEELSMLFKLIEDALNIPFEKQSE